jgi:hypothetical protein
MKPQVLSALASGLVLASCHQAAPPKESDGHTAAPAVGAALAPFLPLAATPTFVVQITPGKGAGARITALGPDPALLLRDLAIACRTNRDPVCRYAFPAAAARLWSNAPVTSAETLNSITPAQKAELQRDAAALAGKVAEDPASDKIVERILDTLKSKAADLLHISDGMLGSIIAGVEIATGARDPGAIGEGTYIEIDAMTPAELAQKLVKVNEAIKFAQMMQAQAPSAETKAAAKTYIAGLTSYRNAVVAKIGNYGRPSSSPSERPPGGNQRDTGPDKPNGGSPSTGKPDTGPSKETPPHEAPPHETPPHETPGNDSPKGGDEGTPIGGPTLAKNPPPKPLVCVRPAGAASWRVCFTDAQGKPAEVVLSR